MHGCYGIELDVQLTKDGEVVIIHDERVDRTTDGTGWVRDYTLAELKKLNAAAVWNGKYGFEPIPTLEEYCQWVKDTSLVTNIEIKSGVYYYENLEEKTLELVKKYGLEKRIVFSSFLHSSITLLRKLAPDIPCGALVEYDDLGNPASNSSITSFFSEISPPAISGILVLPRRLFMIFGITPGMISIISG
jgi:glycerophosphoryl diester phosphodiesterase